MYQDGPLPTPVLSCSSGQTASSHSGQGSGETAAMSGKAAGGVEGSREACEEGREGGTTEEEEGECSHCRADVCSKETGPAGN